MRPSRVIRNLDHTTAPPTFSDGFRGGTVVGKSWKCMGIQQSSQIRQPQQQRSMQQSTPPPWDNNTLYSGSKSEVPTPTNLTILHGKGMKMGHAVCSQYKSCFGLIFTIELNHCLSQLPLAFGQFTIINCKTA